MYKIEELQLFISLNISNIIIWQLLNIILRDQIDKTLRKNNSNCKLQEIKHITGCIIVCLVKRVKRMQAQGS